MKLKNQPFLLSVLLVSALAGALTQPLAAVTYLGNGRTGFGGAVGGGSLVVTDNGTDLSFTFNRGGGDFNDFLVIYFDTASGGASSLPTSGEIGSPNADRRAIVNEYGSGLTFPTLFTSNFAFALKAAGSTSNFLHTTPSGANANTLVFVSSPTVGNFGSNNASSYTWNIPVSSLGMTANSGVTFKFVTSYLNPNTGAGSDASFRSNEAFGYDPGVNNIEFANYTFPSSLSYTIVPEPASAVLGLIGSVLLLRRRRF